MLYDKEKTTIIVYLPTITAQTFDIPETVITIGYYAFQSSQLESIIIPDSVETIDSLSFEKSIQLKSVHIGKNVTTIRYNPFHSCDTLTEIIIDEENELFIMIDGLLIDVKQERLITYLLTNEAETFTVPQNVTVLGDRCFNRNTHLKTIIIHSEVTELQSILFDGCSNLQTIIFEGTSEPSICLNIFLYAPEGIVVEVPSNYVGDTFCGKQVTRNST